LHHWKKVSSFLLVLNCKISLGGKESEELEDVLRVREISVIIPNMPSKSDSALLDGGSIATVIVLLTSIGTR
jgi:hypothetical protein